MAKGNMLQGMARGAVGDIVFSHSKGQQVARVRNRKPANPKSNPQMRQRSAFLCPLLFYKRGKQAQFKFAFENKLPKESDFNAFMRLNALAGIPLTPAERDLDAFPCLGKYAMSRGSLTRLRYQCVANGEEKLGIMVNFKFAQIPTTLAELSAALVATGDYQSGDIVTLFVISGGLIDGNSISEYDRAWQIAQFTLDTNDTTALNAIGLTATAEGFTFPGLSAYDQSCVGVGAIVSRNTLNGLKVSNCDLVLSSATNQVWRYMQSEAYRDYVAAQWGAAGSAILQGSLSVNNGSVAAPSVPTPSVGVTSITVNSIHADKGGSVTLPAAKNDVNIVVAGTELQGKTLSATNGLVLKGINVTNTQITCTADFGAAGKSYDLLLDGAKICTINEAGGSSAGGSEYE